MTVYERWLLPDGVDDLLPPQTMRVERLRRALLDQADSWGYDLISPPLIEFLDSLLTGTGNDLALQTFKVTDQLSGRLMGIRADITPQAARIDARFMPTGSHSRFCYADPVLHTRPSHMRTGRCPVQFGCELFGDPQLSADVEVISLMIESLRAAGQHSIHLDLAHVGIYRGLVENTGLSADQEAKIFDALRRKSVPELDALLGVAGGVDSRARLLRHMAMIAGGVEALVQLRAALTGCADRVLRAMDDLDVVAAKLKQRFPDVELGFDFCELRGYNYHTGLVFAAYVPGFGYAVGQGGRYDSVGREFGVDRPATGFSIDLKVLSALCRSDGDDRKREVILAPDVDEKGLQDVIADLRRSGDRVVCVPAKDMRSGRGLVWENGRWVVKTVEE